MLNALRQVKEDEPGKRFVRAFEAHKIDNHAVRIAVVCLGVGLMLAAAVTFWLPGPNFVLVLAGLALVGAQSRTVAQWMDRGEVAGRRWHEEVWTPYPHKTGVKVAALLTIAVASALVIWFADERGWLPGWVPTPW